MNIVYRFRIYPNKSQKELFARTFGCVRFVYNRMLAEKKEYYEAALIVAQAGADFIKRYAETLRNYKEQAEISETRKQEIEVMAAICEKTATKPADTFYEAIQFTWMLHIIASMQGGSALSFARIDQYLYPYYEKDVKEGRIDAAEAQELLSCLWLKVNEPKMRTVQSVTLGGITRDGKDASNELTRICLQTAADVGMPYPNIGLRVNKANPDWLYTQAVETAKAGCGQPQLLNDDVWMYTGVTSVNGDQSNVGFVLANQRTMETKYYKVEGATESSAMSSAEGQVQNLKYQATFPLLLNIAGEPTYFVALKDDAGLVKKYAMVNVQKYQIVAIGDSVSQCQENYNELLLKNGVKEKEKDTRKEEEISGKITKIAQAVLDGNSHYYLMLEDSDAIYDVSVADIIDVIKCELGEQVTVTYKEDKDVNTVTKLDIGEKAKDKTSSDKIEKETGTQE